MDITFTNAALPQSPAPIWPADAWEQLRLQQILQQASERANTIHQPVLASFTHAVCPCDPLQYFQAFHTLHLGECFYWERPSEQRALVGVGATATIQTTGQSCVQEAAEIWRQLQAQAILGQGSAAIPDRTSGPLLFGGFTFDPLTPTTELWQAFPDGLLLLPYLLFHCDETCAALTINLQVAPDADIASLTAEISAHLHTLEQALARTLPQETDRLPAPSLQIEDLLSADLWMEQVAATVKRIKQGAFAKAVLARAVRVTNPRQDFDVIQTLKRLRESYPVAYVFAIQRQEQYFVGATPERLVCGADGQIQTMALAGSAPRGKTEEEDRQLGEELLHSQKNQGEHHVVVSTIQNALAALCSRVWVGDAPHLLKLKNIQHLQTPITGDMLPGHSILEAIEDLHPTPAVGGSPRQPALEAIRELEQLDRGWYAAPIGWIGHTGNGEFAVALRSGLLHGHQATLFAGCGIVADSDPESEYAESCLKLQVMLRGLSGEE
ncbi:isochorismate synthase [Tengunoibacter tsumagoiensis]|uniref:isochorismate synthase n=1 Tax=Tengunoibacter tsumagoiensis TaxID=2014871 RepID=A0A401ZXC9_9CHLR|nr:isochorismate synthase [Tengunoibacter tsumagoiensis]GCE11506.1 isochorismate synthase [Tengunoibacter tsumagoiensis]